MPSKKGYEQSLIWLKSKMADKDSLDAVNAEICYNVLMDLKKRKDILGAIYRLVKINNERERLGLERLMYADEDLKQVYAPYFVDPLE